MGITNPLVIYHANCWDGFCAAWCARAALGQACEFVAAQYGWDPPDVAGRDVFVLDFSYPRDVTLAMIQRAKSFVLLDHHKTAAENLQGLFSIDQTKSGGRQAWEYFSVIGGWQGMPPPWFVNYTEDRDLWRHALPYSREINAALRSYPLDFSKWDEFAAYGQAPAIRVGAYVSLSSALKNMVAEGDAILRAERQIIQTHVKNAREITLAGRLILVVNATLLFSDIAGELAKGRPFGACYFDRADGKRQWSLRSTPEGVDVSEVARSFGGGGHKHAAGFETDAGPLR